MMGLREFVVGIGIAAAGFFQTGTASTPASQEMKDKSLFDFTMKDIDGKDVKLSKFKGKTILIVNVASACGLTPQYEGLEKLYTHLHDKNFVILGFPANEFGAQEPGSNAEIKAFCTGKYHVTFPMFSKIVVKGEGIHPLYQWLLANTDQTKEIEWNFAKFLINKEGRVVGRFHPKTTPDDAKLVSAIEAELKTR